MTITTTKLDPIIVEAVELGLAVDIDRRGFSIGMEQIIVTITAPKREIVTLGDEYVSEKMIIVYATKGVRDGARFTHEYHRWLPYDHKTVKETRADFLYWMRSLARDVKEMTTNTKETAA